MYKTACRIVSINAALMMIIGIYAICFNSTALFDPINRLMDPDFRGNKVPAGGASMFRFFTWEFLGMFHVLWGVNLLYIAGYGLKQRQAWAWICLALQVVVWLAVVAVFAVSTGHVIFLPVTMFFAVLFIAPLIMTSKILNTGKSGTR